MKNFLAVWGARIILASFYFFTIFFCYLTFFYRISKVDS